MKKRLLVALGSMLMGMAMSAPAYATTVIDFGTGSGGAGGTVSIGANVTGSGIFIDSVIIAGASANNGTFDVDGAGVCADATGGCGLLSFDRNANTISVVGSIPALGLLSQTLLSGDLSGGLTVVADTGVLGSILASGVDAKSRELLLALGLSPTTPFTYFGFQTSFNLSGTGSPYTAVSTDITNTSVPEPASLFLLGSGVAGLTSMVRRRRARKG